jgi:hypothetical protein
MPVQRSLGTDAIFVAVTRARDDPELRLTVRDLR